MSILALDIATSTGWAFWSDKHPSPRFGSCRFAGDIGQFAHEFEEWLLDLLATCQFPKHVYLEAPIATNKTNLSTTMRLIGGQVIAHKVCFYYGIPVTSVSVSEWRKRFIGTARAPASIWPKSARRKWLKDAVLSECHARGLDVNSDDAGDSLGILSFALEEKGRRLSLNTKFKEAA